METTKVWYRSKTVWAGVVAMVLGIISALGMDLGNEKDTIIDVAVQLSIAFAGLAALLSRLVAKDRLIKLIFLPLLLLFAAGCIQRPVSMTPGMAQQVEMASTTTTEFDKRCKRGDSVACAMGLDLANETLSLIVDGLHGRVPE